MARNRKRKSLKRERHHEKINKKIKEIRAANNIVDFSHATIELVMRGRGVKEYTIDPWGDLRIRSKYHSWIAYEENGIIYLLHENSKAQATNYRGGYHIHNVFFDLDYCVKSIVEHDEYVARGYRR